MLIEKIIIYHHNYIIIRLTQPNDGNLIHNSRKTGPYKRFDKGTILL